MVRKHDNSIKVYTTHAKYESFYTTFQFSHHFLYLCDKCVHSYVMLTKFIFMFIPMMKDIIMCVCVCVFLYMGDILETECQIVTRFGIRYQI